MLRPSANVAMRASRWPYPLAASILFDVERRRGLLPRLTARNQATESGAVTDFRDWHVPLGGRFRALKFWMVVRHYGVEGLRAAIREHIRLGKLFASLVESDPRFEVVAPVPFSTVCFRLKSGDATAEVATRAGARGPASGAAPPV